MKNLNLLITCLLFTTISFAQKPEVVLTTGHNDMITCTAISPDGKYFASAGNNKIIKIWDITTGREFRQLTGNDGRINFMKFLPGGKKIGAIENHGSIKIWNVDSGELLSKVPTNYAMTDFAVTNNNSRLIHMNEDGYPELYDLENDKVIAVNDTLYCTTMTFNPVKNEIYSFDHTGRLFTISAVNLEVLKTHQIFDKAKYVYSRPSISADGKHIAYSFGDNTISIFNTNDMSVVYQSKPRTEQINDLELDLEKPIIYYSVTNNDVFVFDFKQKKVLDQINKGKEIFTVNSISRHPSEPILALTYFNKIKFYNIETKRFYMSLESLSNKVINMAYDPTGKYLAGANDKVNIQLWDLEKNKVGEKIPLFFPCKFSADGKYIYASSYGVNIGVFNVQTFELEGIMPTGGELLKKLAISNDGNYLAGSTYTGKIHIYDLESREKIKTVTALEGLIAGLNFSADDNLIAAANMSGVVQIIDWKKDKIVATPHPHVIAGSDVAFSKDGKYFASSGWDAHVFLYSTSDYTRCDTLKGHTNVINSIAFNDASTRLVSGATNNVISKSDNSIITWDLENKSMICRNTSHWDGVNEVVFENGTNRTFSCGNDGVIRLSDADNCESIATFISVGIEDYAILTPDHFYTASKDALNGVSFRINNQLYPFEQFDLKLNRPDIIASRIGKTPEGLIKAYNYVYQKRLRRMGFKEEDLGNDFHLPSISIKDKNKLPVIVNSPNLKFKVSAKDDKYLLDRINVYINDVPIFGSEGIQLKDKIKSIEKEIELSLIPGENDIQISVMNEKGAESLKTSYTVLYETKEKKGDLYILSIGVSDYLDDRFDLKYPSKDADDLINTINKSEILYKNVHVKKMINEEVTLENFQQLSEFFKKAKSNDVVLIFMAGHGVLNAEFDYFFGTYDMDFNNPDEKGLAYDVIDALINEIKALKKLLIMDTCHSGEVDKTEVEEYDAPEVIDGDIDFRAAGVGIREKEAFGLENSFEFMENVFSDIRKGSGATVISSAGGAEFAMESDKWSNGLFTYSLLSGIETREADMNHDGQIKISEIKEFVYKKVNQLSNGKQKPTARQTNIKMDYRLF